MKRSLLTLTLMLLLVGVVSAGTVNGTVTDSTGAAVEGASVILRVVTDSDVCPRGTVYRVLTGADGTFAFDEVPEGTWPIRASKRQVGYTQQDVDVPAEGIVNVDLMLPGCDGTGNGGQGDRPRFRRRVNMRLSRF